MELKIVSKYSDEKNKIGLPDSACLWFAPTACESFVGDVMTRIYTRQSQGVASVKRKAPPKRSSPRKEGRRDFEDDSVRLGIRDVPESQIYDFLIDRIAYHLGNLLEEPNVELGSGSSIPGALAMSSESLALSILSFAASYLDRFKRNRNVSGEQARWKFAETIMTAVDNAAEEILDLVWELSDLAYGDVAESIEKFRERTSNILCDFVDRGPL